MESGSLDLRALVDGLVSFDRLGDVYAYVDGLYESHRVPENTGNRSTDQRPNDFSLQDDNYLIIGSKESFLMQETDDLSDMST